MRRIEATTKLLKILTKKSLNLSAFCLLAFVATTDCKKELVDSLKYIFDYKLEGEFPNIVIMLRIFITTMGVRVNGQLTDDSRWLLNPLINNFHSGVAIACQNVFKSLDKRVMKRRSDPPFK
ncbi:hypothetical protein NPIL_80741 [Nephila pilipes]|uniref:Uncharacterized protein n=1 Tax=Nephila pilipes TaxID=299642 RepID=A0A8X6MAZ2_NEPPI|nr:hypothetical protein NPIL_80741 [Nephila pilipes]